MAKTHKADQREQSQEQPTTPASATDAVTPRYGKRKMSNRTRIISLVIGDILCFLIFTSLGTNAHGLGVNLLNSIWVAVPFLAAWFLISPFVGAFRVRLFAHPLKMLGGTALAWLATWPVAMALRWLLVERANPIPLSSFLTFATVVLLVNMVLLPAWRGLFVLGNSLLSRGKQA